MLRALLVALVSALSLAQIAHAGPAAPAVPDDIAVPAGHKPYLIGHAAGVQIYVCDATATGGHAWRLLAPRATLTDDHGKFLAAHGAGPSWTAKDGSTVIGRRESAATVDATAIDWLRLAAASATPGADGDRLAHTTYIQRNHTAGGLASAAGECTAATAGSRSEVPYTADYVFFKATGG